MVKERIWWKLLAVSFKFRAWIVGFGRRIYTMLSRLGVKIQESKSSLKKFVKKHSNVRRTLRIAGYVIALRKTTMLGGPDYKNISLNSRVLHPYTIAPEAITLSNWRKA